MTALGQSLIPALLRDEGLRLKPYRCTAGKLTIGVGRNLEDVGIREDEAMLMLENDIEAVIADCRQGFPWFASLDAVRQGVIVQMAFNLGIAGLSRFHNTLGAVARGDYDAAADGMLQSKWAQQVGRRAVRLAFAMRTGKVA